MADPRILATAPIPARAAALLAELGNVVVARGPLADEIVGADVLVVRGQLVGADVIAAADRLRVIARTGSGLDNVDVVAATAAGIPVVNAPTAGARPVAEGTWALIVAAAKRLGELRACIARDRWEARYAIEGLDLDGAVLGVVGMGAIGAEVARLARAFGMHVVAADPAAAVRAGEEPVVEWLSLEQLVERADVITLHCPLTDATRGLVDRRLLRRATRAPVFVNASRGGVVASDELLLEALDHGWVSAVALDVFAREPLSRDSSLLTDPRVICTPHAIGLTRGWNDRVFGSLRSDIERVLAGCAPRHLANPSAWAPAPQAT